MDVDHGNCRQGHRLKDTPGLAPSSNGVSRKTCTRDLGSPRGGLHTGYQAASLILCSGRIGDKREGSHFRHGQELPALGALRIVTGAARYSAHRLPNAMNLSAGAWSQRASRPGMGKLAGC
ncbi:MAG: hypothetical protein ACI8QZ_001161 [Chlamydiales bacterium]|jgi:hypothetical protein